MTAEPLTLTDVDAAFHAERRTGIGGGDAAALVGLSRYGSPYSVWARLVGLLHPTPETPRQTIGHELEPVIARLFHRETGLYVAGEQASVRHRRARWARGFVDGFVFEYEWDRDSDLDGCLGGFEAKTDGRFGWPDGVPVNYQAQAQWYMLITGQPRWWFGVLFAGFRFEVFVLDADRADQGLLARRAGQLWHRHVLTGEPPPVDGSDATADTLRQLYPEHVAGETVAVDDLVDVITERFDLKEDAKRIKDRLAVIDNTLKEAIGDAATATVGDVPIFTYRSHERAAYTVAASTVRTLRTTAKKEPQ